MMLMMMVMSTTTTMMIIIIIIIIIAITIILLLIITIIIMTVRPSKIRVIINKQCLFNKIISAKAYCALKKNSISCVLTIPSFFKSFRRGLTKLGNRINRLLSCVISYVIHSVDDGCTVETYLLILKKVALFLKNYVTPLFQTGVFCREGGTSS